MIGKYHQLTNHFLYLTVEPTPRGGFFDNIVCPDLSGVEGNTIACNGEYVAVSNIYPYSI